MSSERANACPALAEYDPLDPAELKDPFPSYARARREAPAFYSDKCGFWSVSRREDVLAILRDTKRFTSRMAIPLSLPPEEMRDRMPVYPTARMLIFRGEAEHGPARKRVQAPFTARRLRDFVPMMRARAEKLLRPDDPDRRIEFIYGFATPLSLVVMGEIMGVPEEDFPLLERAVAGQVRLISGTLRDDEIPALAQTQLEYWEYLRSLALERRNQPREDFSSVLANYVGEDGSISTQDEVAGDLGTILSAGFETSAQMIASGIRAMLEHREQWQLLQSDRSLLETAVEECVRYRSILKRVYRIALTDVEIGGVRIPEGALVTAVLQSSNRDESAFPDPDRFDITRKIDNLTFGRGMHFCVGAPLARLEMHVTLETLLDLAPEVRLVEDQEFRHGEDIALDRLEALHLDLGPVPGSRRGNG
jgi:cytochrome P450